MRLAVDTSTNTTFIAVDNGKGKCVEKSVSSDTPSHTENLSELVKELLCDVKIEFSDLTNLVVGAGPGSFTGLRIGFSFLKGISHALKIPLIKQSSLMAMADEFVNKESSVVSLGDAGRNELYCSIFEHVDDSTEVKISTLMEPKIIPVENLLNVVEGTCTTTKNTIFTGVLSEKIALLLDVEVVKPQHVAQGLLNVGLSNNINDRWDIESLSLIEPIYLRGVNAKTIKEREKNREKIDMKNCRMT